MPMILSDPLVSRRLFALLLMSNWMSPVTYEGYNDIISYTVPASSTSPTDTERKRDRETETDRQRFMLWAKAGCPDLFRTVDIDCALIPPTVEGSRQADKSFK